MADIKKKRPQRRRVVPDEVASPPTPADREDWEIIESHWLRRMLLVFVGFLGIVIFAAGSFIYFYLKGSSSEVRMELEGPEEVFRGVPFDVDLVVENDSDRVLNQAEIVVNLPDDIHLLGNGDSSFLLTDSVGDMGSGSLVKRTYRFLLTAGSGSEKTITFKFSYLSGGRTRFQTSEDYRVRTGREAIEFEVKKPAQILPTSAFEMEIVYRNVSDFDFPETVLEIQYPPAFKFTSANLTPDSLNNYWRLGEVRGGSEGTLEIRGSIQGSGNTPLMMPVTFSASFLGKSYEIAGTNIDLSLAPAPIETKVLINQREDYVPRLGDRLNYLVQYRNLSGIALSDVVIDVELSGDMFDLGTISSGGAWSPAARRISWNADNTPFLRIVDAGGTGEVSFSVNLKNSFPITRLSDKNFVLKASVTIVSPSVPSYLQASETRVASTLETKVAGLIVVDAQGFYRDAESGIVNQGSMPPKAGQPTQYSIHWLVRNYSTDVKDVKVTAALGPGVRWTGAVKSNGDTVPLYNEETNEVSWTIESVRATKGVIDSPLEAVFQIEAIPGGSDIGRFQLLLDSTSLRATDEFTGTELTSFDVAINSSLPDDMTIGQNGGKVVP
ncbi:MAG TPA: hypothetical protein VNK70_01700 [Candidatus Paceibacterota bacterium]|nr:hypothetical protein [Candidatus Paceibacterota bacterium]